ncbi:MAG: NAD(P)/FAD-dependent oxidoreductase [Pseudomonadota bacterium]
MKSADVDVIVVGGGFAGMYALHRLRGEGLSVRVLEAGTNVGGTWYWNRYPGARCDVPSLEYSFGFSRELEREWDWPEVFSAQTDILAYANHVADRFDLRRDMVFNTRVNSVAYDEDDNLWRVSAENGTSHSGRYCVMATGCLSVPNKPKLPGADSFEGQVLHTGLWPKEDVDLTGKRVGIIGTGSSGVQAIPELARMSDHLTVFQRTPVYTVPANRNRMRAEVQDEFRDNYEKIRDMQKNSFAGVSGFQPIKSRRSKTPPTPDPRFAQGIMSLTPEERVELVNEKTLGALLAFREVYTDAEANEAANEAYRGGVRQLVSNPEVADKLCPTTYGLGCKRQVLDRDFYDTFNRNNVTLVDLANDPMMSIRPTGVETDEGLHELDVLIYATGFDAMTGALLRAGIRGRDGKTLNDKWEDGPVAFLGLQMAGFPNLFTITGPGSPSVLCNMLVAIEQHVDWITDCIGYCQANNVDTIEPKPESEVWWVSHVNEVAEGTMYTAPTCNSWYLGANIEGKPRIFMPYVGGLARYRQRCDEIAENDYEGFVLQRVS